MKWLIDWFGNCQVGCWTSGCHWLIGWLIEKICLPDKHWTVFAEDVRRTWYHQSSLRTFDYTACFLYCKRICYPVLYRLNYADAACQTEPRHPPPKTTTGTIVWSPSSCRVCGSDAAHPPWQWGSTGWCRASCDSLCSRRDSGRVAECLWSRKWRRKSPTDPRRFPCWPTKKPTQIYKSKNYKVLVFITGNKIGKKSTMRSEINLPFCLLCLLSQLVALDRIPWHHSTSLCGKANRESLNAVSTALRHLSTISSLFRHLRVPNYRICRNKRAGRLIYRSNKKNSETNRGPLVLCTFVPSNQVTNQSINQTRDQSTNQRINQSINQTRDQLTDQGINQSINQSVIQSINQSINRTIGGSNQWITCCLLYPFCSSFRRFSGCYPILETKQSDTYSTGENFGFVTLGASLS